ncbi:hypothetical protein ACP4OV_020658 [Aristida adscensionis]
MGNLVSQCVVVRGGGERRRRQPLVVGPDGGRRWLEDATGVAELMIEAPGHVVARAADATRERRVRAMAADELLRAGEVYLLVPAGRAGSRLGDEEVKAIARTVTAKRSRKSRARAGGKVFPEANAGDGEEVVVVEGKGFGLAGKRAQVRQWRPVLDTIYEA